MLTAPRSVRILRGLHAGKLGVVTRIYPTPLATQTCDVAVWPCHRVVVPLDAVELLTNEHEHTTGANAPIDGGAL